MKLHSVLAQKDASARDSREAVDPPRTAINNGRISLSSLLNSSSPPAAISPIESKVSTMPSSGVVGQKRKRVDDEPETTRRGFFVRASPNRMVGARTASLTAVALPLCAGAFLSRERPGYDLALRNARPLVQQAVRRDHRVPYGVVRTVSRTQLCCAAPVCDCSRLSPCCRFNRRDFDELMHLHSHSAAARTPSLSLSPFTPLKCCLILPCTASDEEIFRVGKHVHSLLKLKGSLYYRTLDDPSSSEATTDSTDRRNTLSDLLGEDGKMTEDSFRRFAKYRIKREEVRRARARRSLDEAYRLQSNPHGCGAPQSTAKDTADDAGKQPVDHFLGYQRPRSVDYCLQILKTDGWDRQLSS